MPKKSDGYSRVFNLVLYPDDETQKKAIDVLQTPEYQAVGILHDKDTDENGEVKKAHFHFVVKFRNQRSISAVASELEVEENYVRVAGSFENSVKYLTHVNAPDKYQYPDTELVGTLISAAKKIIQFGDEANAALALVDYIDTYPAELRMSELVRYACEHGLWSDLRRGGVLIKSCVSEHNRKYGVR